LYPEFCTNLLATSKEKQWKVLLLKPHLYSLQSKYSDPEQNQLKPIIVQQTPIELEFRMLIFTKGRKTGARERTI
jgi:hypothetical protein